MEFRLAAFYFLFFAFAAAYVAYFPLYLASRDLGAAQIASVLAVAPIMRTFAPALWGWIADRSGAHRGIVVLGCAANAAGFGLMPFTDQLAVLLGITSLLSAAALPLVEAITLASVRGQSGRYGPIRLWGSVGFIAVVLGGGMWLDRQPASTVPWILVFFMLATLPVALALPRGHRHARGQSVPLRFTPEVVALLAASFCNAAAHGALYAFLSLHLERLGYSATMIGFLWTLGVVAEIFVFLYLPQLFRRFSLTTLLVASLGLGFVRFLAIGWLAELLWVVLLAQLLHAATFGSFHAAAVAAVHRVFPDHAQGRGQTLFSSIGYGAGGAVGLLIAGWAWEAGGAAMAFSACALASLAGAFFARRLKRANL
jgi:PPP family 3-phenylpropionic acid transporter